MGRQVDDTVYRINVGDERDIWLGRKTSVGNVACLRRPQDGGSWTRFNRCGEAFVWQWADELI